MIAAVLNMPLHMFNMCEKHEQINVCFHEFSLVYALIFKDKFAFK